MSTLTDATAKADTLAAVALTPLEAGRFTTLSPKTLERYAAAGEAVGRVKLGRRVVYLRAVLEAWLNAKHTSNTTNTTH